MDSNTADVLHTLIVAFAAVGIAWALVWGLVHLQRPLTVHHHYYDCGDEWDEEDSDSGYDEEAEEASWPN